MLLGDAVHGVTPFWGEGMNASFEDTAALDRCLTEQPTIVPRLCRLSGRSVNPTPICWPNLAKQNFIELRDTTASASVVARKTLERKLYQLFPKHWLPLNIMISHRLMTYQAAVARYEKATTLARYGGIELADLSGDGAD